jgi:hypothetical protein
MIIHNAGWSFYLDASEHHGVQIVLGAYPALKKSVKGVE